METATAFFLRYHRNTDGRRDKVMVKLAEGRSGSGTRNDGEEPEEIDHLRVI